MAYRLLGNGLIIILHARQRHGPGEWAEHVVWLDRLLRGGARFDKLLVITDASAPDTIERGEALDVVERHGAADYRNAVVARRWHVRLLIGAAGLFDRRIRAFRPGNLAGALDHLGVPREDRPAVLAAIEALRETLSARAGPGGGDDIEVP